MATKRKGAMIPIGLDDTGINQDLQRIRKDLNKFAADMRGLNHGLKLPDMEMDTRLVQQKIEAFENQIDATKERIQTLQSALKKVGPSAEQGNEEAQQAFKKINREIAISEGYLNKLNREYRNFQEEVNRAKKGLTKLDDEIKDNTQKLDKLDKALALPGMKNSPLLKSMQKNALAENVDLSSQKLKLLQEEYKNTQTAFKNGEISDKEFEEMKLKIEEARGELNKAREDYSKFKKENSLFTKAGDSLISAGNKTTEFGQKVSNVGGKLTTSVTVPGMAMLGGSIKTAADFDQAMIGVRKTTNLTNEEFDAMGLSIREMAKEFPYAAAEIAEVVEMAAQLGVEKDNLLEFTKTILDLGVSTNISTSDGASQIAQLFNILGEEIDNAENFSSTIVDLGNTLPTTEQAILNMAFRIAAAGKQAGLSTAEILSLAATFSSLGLEAEGGGTAISTVLKEMQKASELGTDGYDELNSKLGKYGSNVEQYMNVVGTGGKEATAYTENLAKALGTNKKELTDNVKEASELKSKLDSFAAISGMTAQEFQKSFNTSAPKTLMKFFEGLQKVEEGGGSVIGTLDDLELSAIRVSDAVLRAYDSDELFKKSLSQADKAWKENKALQKEATLFYDSDTNRMKVIKNNIQDMAIAIGQDLMPIVHDLLGYVKEFADWFGELDDGTRDFYLKIGLAAAALGPLLSGLGGIIQVTGGVISAAGSISKAIGGLGLSGGPIFLAIAAIGLLVWAFKDANRDVQMENFVKAGEEVEKSFKNAKASVEDWGKMTDETQTKYNELQESIKNSMPEVTEAIKNASNERRAFTADELKKIEDVIEKYNELQETVLQVNRERLGALKIKISQDDDIDTDELGIYSKDISNYAKEQRAQIEKINDEKLQMVYKAQEALSEAEKSGDEARIREARNNYNKLEQEQVNSYRKSVEILQKEVSDARSFLEERHKIGKESQQALIDEYGETIAWGHRFGIESEELTEKHIEILRDNYKKATNIREQINEEYMANYVALKFVKIAEGEELSEIERKNLGAIISELNLAEPEYREKMYDMFSNTSKAILAEEPEALKNLDILMGNLEKISHEYSVNNRALTDAGYNMLYNLSDGIKQGSHLPKSAMEQAFSSIESFDIGSRMAQVGVNAALGLAKGIAEGANSAAFAKQTALMGAAAIGVTTGILKINSPSKVFTDLGKFLPEGFAIGIKNNLDLVKEASEAMSDAALFNPSDIMGEFNSKSNVTALKNASVSNVNIQQQSQQAPITGGQIILNFDGAIFKDEADANLIIRLIEEYERKRTRGALGGAY